MNSSSETSFVEVTSESVEAISSLTNVGNDLQEPIAIVGLGCRLPGGVSSLDSFWDMLINERTGQCDIPSSRFNVESFYHPDKQRPGSMNTKGGYFIKESIRDFESSFFGINNLEATFMDPQQRKLLEVIFECFESAGSRLEDVSGSNTGVYVGNFTMDFQVMQTRDPEYLHRYSATGMGTTILSNRISHVFNLQGPSLVLDTACSSSLYCLHTAVMALRNRECDAAIAAGVNLIQSPEQHIGTMKAGVLSQSSTCHSFSDQADGYGRADGVGAVYVKRLSDAIANRDPIRAVIRGSAVNANGKTPGITQPSSAGQEAVVRKSHAQAGLDLRETSYVEAHGTGTPVGDPIEIRGLANAFANRSKASPLLIGSVKTNLGHSEAASGISSIIKVVLALERGVIPPTVNVKTLNPDIKAYDWNVEIVTRNTPWPCDGSDRPRRAGINSFGYGGANVHVVVESPEAFVPAGYHDEVVPTKVLGLLDKKFLLPFSASSQSALLARVADFQHTNVNLVDLAYTLTSRRSKLQVKGFLIAQQHTLIQDLQAQKLITPSGPDVNLENGFTFVFTGQGAQWAEMGKGLIEQYPNIRASVSQFDAVLKSLKHPPSWTLVSALTEPASKSRINEVTRAQPACTAIQIALIDLLASWGITPSAVIGHSSGEIAAAYAAGLLSSAEAISIAYYRGYVVGKLSVKGTMMAVGLGQEEAQAEIERNSLTGKVVVACINSPESVTLSGDADGIDAFYSAMGSSDVLRRKLLTDGRAYHSHHMAEVGAEYENLLRSNCRPLETRVKAKGLVTWISSVTLGSNTTLLDYSYWRHNLEKPVLFEPALRKLLETHQTPIIEIGPHGALKMPIKQTQAKEGVTTPYFQALTRGESSDLSLLKLIGNLYVAGANVPLNIINGLDNVSGVKDLGLVGKVSKNLPTYQWTYDHTLWHESRMSSEFRNRKYPRHELLGSMTLGGNLSDFIWRNLLDAKDVPWIQDHRLDSTVVFPAAGYIAVAIEALSQALGKHQSDGLSYELHAVNIMAALTISSQDQIIPVEIFTTLRKRAISATSKSKKWWEFEIVSVRDDKPTTHATGSIAIYSPVAPLVSTVELDATTSEPSAVRNWYKKMKNEGLNFGTQFQTLKKVEVPRNRHDRWAISDIDVHQRTAGGVEQDSSYTMHPTSIDGMLQTSIIAGAHGIIPDLLAQVPVAFERAIIKAPSAVDLASRYTVYANSHATSFSTATITTELRTASGQVQAQICNMRLKTYQGSSSNENINERHPMLRVCWRPDLASVRTAPDALKAFVEREAVLEGESARQKTTSTIYKMSIIAELVCHKNPRTRILYLPSGIQSLNAVDYLLTKLGSGTDFHLYGSFVIGDMSDNGVVNKKQLFDTSALQQLESLPKYKGESTVDLIIATETLKNQEGLEFLLPLLSNNGLLITPDTSNLLTSILQQNTDGLNAWEASNLCGVELIQKRGLDAQKQTQIKDLVVVEDEIGSALGDAIVKSVSRIAYSVTRLAVDAVSLKNIPPKSTVVATIEARKPFLSIINDSQMAQTKIITDHASNIVWVTASGMLDGDLPDVALAAGLSRALMLEQPYLRFYTLDIDKETPDSLTADHVAFILSQVGSSTMTDYEFVEKNSLLHVSRFVPDKIANEKFQQRQGKRSVPMELEKAGDGMLHIQGTGRAPWLCFKQEPSLSHLKAEFVEVEVKSHGIGTKESAMLLGHAESKNSTCATEFTGIVKAVGSSVSTLAPGDHVAVMAPNHFRLVEQVPAWACQKLKSNDSLTALSTVFVAYSTALYALHNRAYIQSGETLLVHIDGSGIGLAAARVANLAGAEVFATVSTADARDLLVKSFGFEANHVFVLDESSYLADIMAATKSRGVDVVLNSLGGDLLHDSWRACADFGRFIEIGNRNTGSLDMNFFSKQLTFTAFELESLFYSENIRLQQKWSSLMRDVLELYRQNSIWTAKSTKIFYVSELSEAYRHVATDKEVCKVAVSLENPQTTIDVLPQKYSTSFFPEKTYFLVGCLGGLGASLAKWMVSRGARKFVFLGRSGADRPAARRLVEDLRASGIQVSVERGDVGNTLDVQRAIDNIEGTIGGIVQAAMGLSEALFTTMSNSAWHTGVDPKLRGTWNIHNALAEREAAGGLDFFLMTSSVTGSVGTATESNYCAANHFLDTFARYRRARNQPATSLGLGRISEVGYLHENPDIEEVLARKGIQETTEDELLQIVDIALSPVTPPDFLRADPLAHSHILTGLEPLALKELRNKGFDTSNPILSDPRSSLLATTIDGLASEVNEGLEVAIVSTELTQAMEAAGENASLGDVVGSLVAKRFHNLILIPLEKLDTKQPLSTYGLDSMLAAEFRSWVYKVFKFDVPFLDLLSQTMSLDSLANSIEKEVSELLA